MPYEIPKNLKYEEKIIFNLSAKQCLWLGIFLLAGAAFFLKTGTGIEFKAIVFLLLAGLGFGFAFLDFSQHSRALASFLSARKESGFFDPESEKFTGVKAIECNGLMIDDGSKKAIIEVFPINFKILSVKQQEAVVTAYRDFLNSLDFPIQVFVRTSELCLADYLEKISKSVQSQGKSKTSDYFFEFREFIEEYARKNSVRNRRFFIVLGQGGNENGAELDARCGLCISKLKKCGLSGKRLASDEIAGLFLGILGNTLNSKFENPGKVTLLCASKF